VKERHHNELKKMSDTALFFGCGPSINDITKDDWEVLKKYDVWAVNFFLYHDFIVPDFYYRGCGKTDEFFDKFRGHWNKKKKGPYKDTKFITKPDHWGKIKKLDLDEVYIAHLRHSWKRSYKQALNKGLRKGELEKKTHEIALKNFRIMPNKLYFYGRATLCFLLVLMYQMGYKEIVLYGNDLNSKMYFWSDRPKNEIHWRWVKQTKMLSREREREGPHPNIISVKTFVPWFNKNYMNNRIFVGNKKTLLFPGTPYKSIEELK